MDFEWDEAKQRGNLTRHGVDFEAAVFVFRGPHLTAPDGKKDYGEARYRSVGLAGGTCIVVVHTERSGRTRLISARLAGRGERRA